MKEIYKNIFIGTEQDCTLQEVEGLAVIHACKHPCHVKFVGYKGNLPQNHPNYLIAESENHLVLNMVDMEKEFHPKFTHPMIKASMNFIQKHINNKKILIHCNQGQSRSPSIALIYLARIGVIDNSSLQNSQLAFKQLYPYYKPGNGILKYMNRNWQYLMKEL